MSGKTIAGIAGMIVASVPWMNVQWKYVAPWPSWLWGSLCLSYAEQVQAYGMSLIALSWLFGYLIFSFLFSLTQGDTDDSRED